MVSERETNVLFPLLWVGLLPSQLRAMSPHVVHLQPLSTRDESLLVTLKQKAREWHPTVLEELEEMSRSRHKAELQCLFGLESDVLKEDAK